MANTPGNPTSPGIPLLAEKPVGPIEADARTAVATDQEWAAGMIGAAREVYIVSSRYGPEGIYSTPDRARDKVNLLMGLAAYRDANSGLLVRPYILDSE
jgi:hypothetical protein